MHRAVAQNLWPRSGIGIEAGAATLTAESRDCGMREAVQEKGEHRGRRLNLRYLGGRVTGKLRIQN
jgi:hypothetical protein